ncbi:hypothetical protein O6H91_06G003400 [Diphasiastrum complanatum]|uniref:Uncharacterized protein n=1 Tax=Diphasiastrum complanatum TaxID=34168 RepID=A0ACC2DAQ3_DIPCM|nr:hypothetical protein O6H91_06G003400 [Diphasiastrum complanatum]
MHSKLQQAQDCGDLEELLHPIYINMKSQNSSLQHSRYTKSTGNFQHSVAEEETDLEEELDALMLQLLGHEDVGLSCPSTGIGKALDNPPLGNTRPFWKNVGWSSPDYLSTEPMTPISDLPVYGSHLQRDLFSPRCNTAPCSGVMLDLQGSLHSTRAELHTSSSYTPGLNSSRTSASINLQQDRNFWGAGNPLQADTRMNTVGHKNTSLTVNVGRELSEDQVTKLPSALVELVGSNPVFEGITSRTSSLSSSLSHETEKLQSLNSAPAYPYSHVDGATAVKKILNLDTSQNDSNGLAVASDLDKNRLKRRRNKRLQENCQVSYAIQTISDNEVINDGYKWRKYGQKTVKNSHHPRSYYRCSYTSCSVKKKVQRSDEEKAIVITTYEGTHSHQGPKVFVNSPQLSDNSFQLCQNVLTTIPTQNLRSGSATVAPLRASQPSETQVTTAWNV